MKYWASVEVDMPAYEAIVRAELCVKSYLNSALARSPLKNIKIEIRYVPIVMTVDAQQRYPERSKARIKQRIYDCAPHLDYEIFVNGDLPQQLTEYIRGLALAIPDLHKFGISPEQVEEFQTILDSAVDTILEERPDQTRH